MQYSIFIAQKKRRPRFVRPIVYRKEAQDLHNLQLSYCKYTLRITMLIKYLTMGIIIDAVHYRCFE